MVQSGGRFANFGTIDVSLDGLFWGNYNYTLIVRDELGNQVSGTVWVTVLGPNRPILSSPPNIYHNSRENISILEWTIQDDDAVYYQVLRNGSVIDNGDVGDTVSLTIQGLSRGVYNYTLIVTDSKGVSSNDSVMVRVDYSVSNFDEVNLAEPLPIPWIQIGFLVVVLGVAAVLLIIVYKAPAGGGRFLSLIKKGFNNRKVTAVVVLAVIGVGLTPLFIWFITKPEPKIPVAVIDSGIDDVPSIEGRLVAGKSFIQTEYGFPRSILVLFLHRCRSME